MGKGRLLFLIGIVFSHLSEGAVTSSTTETVGIRRSHLSDARIAVASSYGLLNGNSGWGTSAEVMFNTGTHLYVGFVSGYYQWNTNTSGTLSSKSTFSLDGRAYLIPVLASAIYTIPGVSEVLRPYLGVAVGIGIT